MHNFRSILILGLFAALQTSASLSFPKTEFVSYPYAKSYYEATVDLAEPEQYRIRKHLAAVEADLRQHTPAGLSMDQKRARAQRLEALHEYWVRGEFPKNRDYSDSLVPYFIDAEGVPCAVGYLVIASGNRDFAEEIRWTRNHAYIREIKDPRLKMWADASGLTLKECARIQPAYGPPTIKTIRGMDIDSSGRLWVTGPDANSVNFGDLIAYWQANRWTVQYGSALTQCFCVTLSGQSVVGMSNGIQWNSKTFSPANSFTSCSGFQNGPISWMGNNQGLVRINVLLDTLIQGRYLSPLSSNSATVVAATQNYAWMGTPVGLAGRNITTGAWLTRDSTTLNGVKVTGLKAGKGDTLWVGVDAPSLTFTGKGLRRYNGQTWTSYQTNNSVLPSDTVQSIELKSGNTVWIACASGLYEFTPPSGIRKLTNLVGGQTIKMVVSSQGQLYVGTSNNGVYRLENDTLKSMGYPVPILANKKRAGNKTAVIKILSGPSHESGAQTLLGRRANPNLAAGVYVLRPAAKPSP